MRNSCASRWRLLAVIPILLVGCLPGLAEISLNDIALNSSFFDVLEKKGAPHFVGPSLDDVNDVSNILTPPPISASFSAGNSAGGINAGGIGYGGTPNVGMPNGASIMPNGMGTPNGMGMGFPNGANGMGMPTGAGFPTGMGIPTGAGMPNGMGGIPNGVIPGMPNGTMIPGMGGMPNGMTIPGMGGGNPNIGAPNMNMPANMPKMGMPPMGMTSPNSPDANKVPKGQFDYIVWMYQGNTKGDPDKNATYNTYVIFDKKSGSVIEVIVWVTKPGQFARIQTPGKIGLGASFTAIRENLGNPTPLERIGDFLVCPYPKSQVTYSVDSTTKKVVGIAIGAKALTAIQLEKPATANPMGNMGPGMGMPGAPAGAFPGMPAGMPSGMPGGMPTMRPPTGRPPVMMPGGLPGIPGQQSIPR